MPWHGTQEAGIAEDERRRKTFLVQQPLRTVEIREDQVEQARPLHERRRQPVPLVERDEERHHVQRPRAVDALRIAVHVVGDAGVADRALRVLPPRRDLVRPERLERLDERLAVRTQLAVGVDQLVGRCT